MKPHISKTDRILVFSLMLFNISPSTSSLFLSVGSAVTHCFPRRFFAATIPTQKAWLIEHKQVPTKSHPNGFPVTVVAMNSNKVNAMNSAFFVDLHDTLSALQQYHRDHGGLFFQLLSFKDRLFNL
jgi:hypothetical protein